MTTKTSQAVTQLVADGNSDEIDLSAIDEATWHITHSNGSGTPTSPATITVEVLGADTPNWDPTIEVVMSLVDGDIEQMELPIPRTANKARLKYVQPVGSTGHTLDAVCSMYVK
jgi:hypothetical protein